MGIVVGLRALILRRANTCPWWDPAKNKSFGATIKGGVGLKRLPFSRLLQRNARMLFRKILKFGHFGVKSPLFAVIPSNWTANRFLPQKKVGGNARHGPLLGPINLRFTNSDLAYRKAE